MDREEATQVVPENPNHSQQSAEISKMKCQINQQTIELDRLKQQVETLQNLVAFLSVTSKNVTSSSSLQRTSHYFFYWFDHGGRIQL